MAISPARDLSITTDLFPSFVLGGFECSTPLNFDRKRIDEMALTRHDARVASDYRLLRAAGILVARDGVRWNLVDRGGRLDFSSAMPFIRAAEEEGITIIWDLFHYGYPEDLDPFREPFVERFAAYCRAFATLLVKRGHGERRGARGQRFYTPVNEISFFAWAGGQVGMFAPFAIGRAAELKRRLAQAAIAGINAIREVDPRARMVNCDPVVRVVAPADAPWLEDEARYFNDHFVFESFDMLAGRTAPELGGSPRHLDIAGINYYGVNQWEHQRSGSVLAEDDPRRLPFSKLLIKVHRRYDVPVVVTETASYGEDRARWLHQIGRQCLIAREEGVDLHGICVYPVVGMADWESLAFRPMGLWDARESDVAAREPCRAALAAVRDLQRIFDRPAAAAVVSSRRAEAPAAA